MFLRSKLIQIALVGVLLATFGCSNSEFRGTENKTETPPKEPPKPANSKEQKRQGARESRSSDRQKEDQTEDANADEENNEILASEFDEGCETRRNGFRGKVYELQQGQSEIGALENL